MSLRIILAIPLAVSLCGSLYASDIQEGTVKGPRVQMVFDPNIVNQKVNSSNVGDHLDNLVVALMEGREDLLAQMDSKGNRMGEKELQAARNYISTMSKYEIAALKAALKKRDNKNALKQVQKLLKGK